MNTIKAIVAVIALLLSFCIQAQNDSNKSHKPMILDGKKFRITIDTKEKSEESKTSKFIIDGDTTIIDDGEKDDNERLGNTGKGSSEDKEDKKNPREWFRSDFGFNFFVHNGTLDMPEAYKDLELENGKGCNFNLRVYEQSVRLIKSNLFLVYGVGIDWNNYRFKNNIDLIKDSTPLAYSFSQTDYTKNKLVSTYLTVPLMLKVRFKENSKGDAFQFALGPQFGYLLNTHLKQKWRKDGRQDRRVDGDFNLEEFRIGYGVYLGYKDIDFYIRYFPESAFKSGKGPNVNTVSMGLAFGGF